MEIKIKYSMLQEYLDTQTFGERIKALRKQNNMKQEQLAEALYLENKAIKKIDCK